MIHHALDRFRRRLWGRKVNPIDKDAASAAAGVASFELRLGSLLVGKLSVQNGRWSFEYSDAFRARRDMRPLPIFPKLDKVYESDDLWSFFKMRIPSLKQPAVHDILVEEKIDPKDQVQLLRRFGRRTVSNPFELIESREMSPDRLGPETLSRSGRTGKRTGLRSRSRSNRRR